MNIKPDVLAMFFFMLLLLTSSLPARAQVSDHLYEQLPDNVKPASRAHPTFREQKRIIIFASLYATITDTATVRELDAIASAVEKEYNHLDRKGKATLLASLVEYKSGFRYLGSPNGEWVPYCRRILELCGNDTAYAKYYCIANTGIGMFHAINEQYEQSMPYCMAALDMAKRVQDSSSIRSAAALLEQNFVSLGLYRQAISFDSLANSYITADEKSSGQEEIFRIDSYGFIAGMYMNMYRDEGNPAFADSALSILNRIPLTGKHADWWREAYLFGMGQYYFTLGNYATALPYLDSALSSEHFYMETHNMKLLLKGICLMKTGKGREGSTLLLHNDAIAQDLSLAETSYRSLYEYAKANGDYKSALIYTERSDSVKDAVQKLAQRGKVFEITQKYNLREKQDEIEKLALKSAVQQKQRNSILLAGSALVLLLSSVIAVLYSFNKKKEVQRLKVQQALETERKQMQLFLDEQDMRIKVETEAAVTQQRRKISTDLHDGLSGTLAALRYYVNDIRLKAETPREQKTLQNIEDEVGYAYTQARDYMHSLHSGEEAGRVDLGDFLDRLQQQFSTPGGIQIKPEVDMEEIDNRLNPAQQMQLYLTIREAIANSLKYAAATIITISIFFETGRCLFHITDNGGGFKNTGSKGLGLESMRERIRGLHGNLDIEHLAQGTSVQGAFPLA